MLRSMLKVLMLMVCVSVFAACGGDDGDGGGRQSILGDCPSGSDTQQASGQTVFQNNCSSCHAGFAQASGRSGLPAAATASCSDLASVADCMYDRSANGEMPPAPAGDLSDAQVEDLRVWLACNK